MVFIYIVVALWAAGTIGDYFNYVF